MTKPSIDLGAYFERIEWGGAVRPTFETLAGMLHAHMSRIPFENLDVLLHRPVRLDFDGLQEKLVRARRGGYCFEHATLFAAALEQVGFAPVRHTARVVLLAPRTASPSPSRWKIARCASPTMRRTGWSVTGAIGCFECGRMTRSSMPGYRPWKKKTRWISRWGTTSRPRIRIRPSSTGS
ncbi:MAG: arylamine N-acetyltransferase [Betaproteobacteria bacterium]|nr:MAG: arylamine N-acetyltransferase [Betaproteobacteria bacterium]